MDWRVLTVAMHLVAGVASGQCDLAHFESPLDGYEDLGADLIVVGDRLFAGVLDVDYVPFTKLRGSVIVYQRDGAHLIELVELKGPDPDDLIDTQFGEALDAGADTTWLAVGDDAYQVAAGFPSGAVFLYEIDSLALHSMISTPDSENGDLFGKAVALSGDRLVVGAPRAKVDGLMDAGLVYAYRFDGRSWQLEQAIAAPSPDDLANFGWCVDAEGDSMLIGSHSYDLPASGTGRVYAYTWDGAQWAHVQDIIAPETKDWFGRDVDMNPDATVAIIGAPQDLGQSGSAFVYTRNPDTDEWTLAQKLTAAKPVGPWSFFGMRVSISDDGQVIGIAAPDDWESGGENGAVHIFRHDGSQYTETAKLLAPSTAESMGYAIATTPDGDIAYIQECDGPTDTCGISLYAGLHGLDCNTNGEPDSCEILDGNTPDANDNLIPDTCECPGDTDGDGKIDSLDLNILLAAFGDPPSPPQSTTHPADFDADGDVDSQDLNTLLAKFGGACR